MIIENFKSKHIDEAIILAKKNYERERSFVSSLPFVKEFPDLKSFADNNLGVCAFKNGKMVGFLSCYLPIENAFGTTGVKGTFTPCNCHGAIEEDRKEIYSRLYEAAAHKWVKAGILSHAIALYAHDDMGIRSFFENGFGLRCIDAIRPMEEIALTTTSEFSFAEIDESDKSAILELNNLLIRHMSQSPIFMPFPPLDKIPGNRFFGGFYGKKLVAYIKLSDDGENFAAELPSMINICGAFCLPGYRGMGIYQNLLNFMIKVLKSEDYSLLGVDFESFNPTARGFWLKYFIPYTNSVVRRIDDFSVLPKSY